jgi:SAM-dependent methyltransferase
VVVSPSGVVWHELECGSYRADLPLWLELAASTASGGGSSRVLDVGAGTGRVALELARAGHLVTALDLDPELLEALRQRAGGARIETVCADARSFELSHRDFDLCLVPMQTVQLLKGPTERLAFLRRARAHLRRGGMLAMAIVTEVEPFDCADGRAGPSAEIARVGGTTYASRPTRVSVSGRSALIERERRVVLDRECQGTEPEVHLTGPSERSVVELHLFDASELEREAIGAGLQRERVANVLPTEDHVGSAVVIVRA